MAINKESFTFKEDNYELETNLKPAPLENKAFVVVLTFFGSLGGFILGYDTTIIGGASLYIYDDLGHGTPEIKELVVSMTLLGAAIGSLSGGQLGDRFGRRVTIMMTDIVFIIGELVMAATVNIPMLLAGRFIVGFSAGVMAMTGPNYLAEVAPNSHRGIIVGMNVVFIGAAQFVCYVLALALVPHWRIMLGLSVVFSVTQFIGMYYMPESPRWLFKVKKDQEAIAALTRIRLPPHKRDPQYIQEEITRMQFEQSSDISEPYFTQLRLLFTKYRTQIMVGSALQMFQMLTGINNAMYYGPQIIISSGLASSKEMGLVYSLAFVGMLLISVTLGVVYSDSIGRRSILLWTLPGVSASLAGLAVIFYMMVYENATGTIAYFVVIIIVIYIAFYAAGIGPVPWTVNSEIYPNQLQSIASSVAATFNWVFNFIVSMTFLTLMSFDAGKVIAWAVPAVCTAICWLFVLIYLPETKGRSLGEILELFKGNKKVQDSLL